MEIYLVGGAVRDKLLKLPVKERDWVVVGATIQEMLDLGYKPIGKDFPVFLHPKTHEEYALARTERKTGKGYKGFVFHAAPNVTLEEDLKRRDLTINAIAESPTGILIDPFHGIDDIKKKILRHVSDAFVEDPVRVLRIARFAARFADFTLHPTTIEIIRKIVSNGEIDTLVPERVWQEFERALKEKQPWRFFEVLKSSGALFVLFPEINNQYTSAIAALKNATYLTNNTAVRFAALTSPIKEKDTKPFFSKNRVPKHYADLTLLIVKHRNAYLNSIENPTEETLLTTLELLDAFRRPNRFQDFLLACKAIFPEHNQEKIKLAHKVTKNIDPKIILKQDLSGKEIKEIIREERLKKIRLLE